MYTMYFTGRVDQNAEQDSGGPKIGDSKYQTDKIMKNFCQIRKGSRGRTL